jgi:hypothetical protein
MLIADLKGKLSLSELTSEDFLTSSVFSVFRYLEEHWLERFINQAVNIKSERLNIKLEIPSYEFWPWFSNEPKLGGGAEPDVVIYSEETALIIEAKNYSGKSGEGIILCESEQSIEKDKIKETKVIADQLGREYFVGLNKIINSKYIQDERIFSIKSFYVIFLTRHIIFPEHEIKVTIDSIARMRQSDYQNALNRIYWLNWQKVVPILEEIVSVKPKNSFEYKISQELIEFLERRDLAVFSGFKFLSYYKEFPAELELIKDIDFLFYRKIYREYWGYLRNFKPSMKNQLDNIFYKQQTIPYWNFLKFNFNILTDEQIFYSGGN